jgi:hypothetical protein
LSTLPSPQGGEAFLSSFLLKGKALSGAWQCLAGLVGWGRACRRAFRGQRSWTPSRIWQRIKGFRHDRASEDAGRERSHDIFEKLCRRIIPCLHHDLGPLGRNASAGFLPSLVEDGCRIPDIYSRVSVGFRLRVALCCSEAMADPPTTPWFGCRAVRPYPQPSWNGPSGRRWDPLVQSDGTCRIFPHRHCIKG